VLKKVDGIWLPESETHLQSIWHKWPKIDGAATYQFDKLELAMGYVKRFNTAIDIGAHVGLWSRILIKYFRYVEAFEPIEEHRICFRLNVLSVKMRLHQFALGAKVGQAKMTICPDNTGHSHVAVDGNVVVPVLPLDKFAFDDVNFIKIDVEGQELDVLQGAQETLLRCRPTLIVEQKQHVMQETGTIDQDALAFLDSLGARKVAERNGDHIYVWSKER
jgi:FkbM family methyltransferase